MSKQSTLLSAHDLHKHYHMGGEDLHILRGVDLTVKRNEWLAIIGSSGSGKSTLLHLLGGLDRPSQGQVYFDGDVVDMKRNSALDRYRNRDVGFVFQFYHLLPELTTLENVMLSRMVNSGVLGWLSVRAQVKERATQLLEQMGLSHRLKHRPNKLSGGERQRVAIARALLNEPPLLLADEPTGNLDADTGGQILELLQELHAGGQTIVMVTHDPKIAAAADRQLILERGRLQ